MAGITALARTSLRAGVRRGERLEALLAPARQAACGVSHHHSSSFNVKAPRSGSLGVPHAHVRAGTCLRRRHIHASATPSSGSSSAQRLTILVLGGTGFVGRTFISLARRQGHRIISLSRRGKLQGEAEDSGITWEQGDATDPQTLQRLVSQHPDINACMHCVGLLLDEGSGLSQYNRVASGSGSEPGPGSSYDQVTRATAFNAIQALAQAGKQGRVPFVFVSAAEAGWTFTAPVPWLERYLIAKRAVEAELMKESGPVRGVMLRPSLIWTWERPQALASVLPFYIGSAIGLPFVDRPVTVETVAKSALVALLDEREAGVKRYMDMDALAARL